MTVKHKEGEIVTVRNVKMERTLKKLLCETKHRIHQVQKKT